VPEAKLDLLRRQQPERADYVKDASRVALLLERIAQARKAAAGPTTTSQPGGPGP